jgi:uncharacterized damage-inducible protein DinB
MAQLDDADLTAAGPGGNNSIATIVWHMSGNLRSRFTDFLTSDGEKPWRHRDEEFEARAVSRAELLQKWDEGWQVLLDALEPMTDSDLGRTVTIRSQPLLVREALLRSLAHASYHVGQVVLLARAARGPAWTFLSIPPGQSERYNQAPADERAPRRESR